MVHKSKILRISIVFRGWRMLVLVLPSNRIAAVRSDGECASTPRLRIRDLNLDRTTLWVSARLKRTNRILDRKPVGHQLPDVAQDATLH